MEKNTDGGKILDSEVEAAVYILYTATMLKTWTIPVLKCNLVISKCVQTNLKTYRRKK